MKRNTKHVWIVKFPIRPEKGADRKRNARFFWIWQKMLPVAVWGADNF